MPSPTIPEPESFEARLLIAITRLDTKLDVALANQSDHETRLRKLEDEPPIPEGLETRLRQVETRPSVSPRALGATVVSVTGLLLAAMPFLDRLYS